MAAMTKRCAWCGKAFRTYREQTCCSHACRSGLACARLGKRCRQCGRPFRRREGEQFSAYKRRHFCSPECYREHARTPEVKAKCSRTWFRPGPAHRYWKGGRSYAFDADLRWERQRVEALRRDGHRCQFCGREAPDVRLAAHHVRPFPLSRDNSLRNLITLCRSCHTHIHMMARREIG